MGICRVEHPDLYDKRYFQSYVERDATKTGARLTSGRINLVRSAIGSWGHDTMVDVGIGGGRFVREADCMGCDINPDAVDWLKGRDRWFDLERGHISIATFWDSLEHIVDARRMLFNVMDWVFVSTPIYKDMNHVLRSKHFKPGEHVYYWTRAGVAAYMEWHGFDLVKWSEFEQACGREDIESFAFKRRQFVK